MATAAFYKAIAASYSLGMKHYSPWHARTLIYLGPVPWALSTRGLRLVATLFAAIALAGNASAQEAAAPAPAVPAASPEVSPVPGVPVSPTPAAASSPAATAESKADAASTQTPTVDGAAAATQTAAESAAQTAEDEEQRRRNTFYLLERVSVSIPGGLRGVRPGTMVRRLYTTEDGKFQVTDGETSFPVPTSMLTQDLEVAAKLEAYDLQAQRAAWNTMDAAARQQSEEERKQRAVHSHAVDGYNFSRPLTGESSHYKKPSSTAK